MMTWQEPPMVIKKKKVLSTLIKLKSYYYAYNMEKLIFNVCSNLKSYQMKETHL